MWLRGIKNMTNDLISVKEKYEILDRDFLESKVYEIRGRKVMLDFDLAEIYGYTTKAFNQQVKKNIEKFDSDFMFQLTRDEYRKILRSKKLTLELGQGKYSKYNPYAFTEQGVYMLMTVLRGEKATRQSKALIRLFKEMKDYITYSDNFVTKEEFLKLESKTNDIMHAQEDTKKELKKIMNKFIDESKFKEHLILDGHMVESDIAYTDIYNQAKKSIYIIDNYINLKTLALLRNSKAESIIVFSDNINHCLHKTEYLDFQKEYKNLNVKFIRTNNKFHDRFIIIDYKNNLEKIYHCGASSKDSGKRVTAINLIENTHIYYPMIDSLSKNKELVL